MRHRCGRYMGLGLDTPLYLICHPLVLAMNYLPDLPRIAVMPMNVIVSAGKGVLDRKVYLGGRALAWRDPWAYVRGRNGPRGTREGADPSGRFVTILIPRLACDAGKS